MLAASSERATQNSIEEKWVMSPTHHLGHEVTRWSASEKPSPIIVRGRIDTTSMPFAEREHVDRFRSPFGGEWFDPARLLVAASSSGTSFLNLASRRADRALMGPLCIFPSNAHISGDGKNKS
jgi:hypothetical protein